MNHISLRRNTNKKRKKSGFRTLMKTQNGRRIIKQKRKKGRKSL